MSNTITEIRLRELMDRKNWSLGDLSQATDIPKTTLHRYLNETRIIPLERITILATALNTTPEFLLGWDTDEEETSIYGDHKANLEYCADKPEMLEIYNEISNSETLQLLFDSVRDLSPQDLETVLMIIKGIKRERNKD